MKFAVILFLISLPLNATAVKPCGKDYKKCVYLMAKTEKLVRDVPYDVTKSYHQTYPINHMYIYDSIIVNFSKKVPKNFKEDDKNLRLALRAWGFYNQMLPDDFFSIAPFKRLWCKNGKVDDKKIKEVANSVFVGKQKLKEKFEDSIKECGSCKNVSMCEGL